MMLVRRSVLALRILTRVMLTGFAVFALATTFGFIYERDKALQVAHMRTEEAVNRSLSAISVSLWQYDIAGMNALLMGMVRTGVVVHAEVDDLDKAVANVTQPGFAGKADQSWSVPIMSPDGTRAIGTLHIAEAYSEVNQELLDRFTTLVLTDLFKIVGLALALFAVVYGMVARHLHQLAADVMRLAQTDDAPRLSVDRKKRGTSYDEIDILVDAINRFIAERKQAEVLNRQYEAIIRSSDDAIIGKTLDGLVTTWNPGAEAIFGYSEAEMLGQPMDRLFPPELKNEEADFLEQIRAGKTIDHIVTERIRKDGRRIYVSATISPIYDPDGQIVGASKIARDITEQIRNQIELEEHRNNLERLVAERTAELKKVNERLFDTQFAMDYVGIGITWADAITGRIVYTNPFQAGFLGYSVEEMLQLSIPDIDPGFTAETYEEMAKDAQRQGSCRFEAYQRARDGRRLPVEITVYYHAGNETTPPRLIGFMVDIAKRKEAEQALQEAKEAAEAANLAKSRFLANMSHEIRTPLNAITGMVHLLRRSPLTEEQQDRLLKIDTAGHHLLEIINDILDLSKIEADKLVLEKTEVHIGSIFGNVVSMLGERARKKHLELRIENAVSRPDALLGDPTRIQQALLNFASNAVKFTDTGHVTLRAWSEDETEDEVAVHFEVEDTGIGIEPEAMAQLFLPFQQADDSTTRKYGGTGLGLIISKRLAELMGGDAGARSVPGSGSVFWFSVRLEKSHAQSTSDERAAADAHEIAIKQDHRGKRILLAEDDPVNQEVAAYILREVGFDVTVANNGQQAVELVTAQHYDLILMDMQMPVMDGLIATRRIRDMAACREVPIVAMTANAFADDRTSCYEAGMDDFIPKPVVPETLFSTLHYWLTHKHAGGQPE
jgi:PAS domain S-box-containing protein